VIAGVTDDPANGINNDTTFSRWIITDGTLSFAQHYALTTPNFPRTESVVPVGSTFPTPGFLLSTNSFNTYGGGTNEDAHIIKTDVLGQVNAAACLSDTLKFKVDTVKANIKNLCTVQFCAITDSLKMKMKKVFPPHQLCFSATKEAEEISLFSETDELQITVAPNPSYGSEDIRLYLSAEVSGNYNVRILNISGQVVKEVNGIFEEGDSDVSINTGDLSEGIYLITLFNGVESSTCKFLKLK
jgi:hypothetical protein